MDRLLKEGDIVEIKEGHTFYFDLPEHFVFANRRGVFNKLARTELRVGTDYRLNTEFLEGKWIVTKTSLDGGGTGHGPHDVYPNGHHVWIEKVPEEDDNKIKAHFYQTGAFTAMIPKEEIEVVGKAKKSWVME